jgi:hypothetical protein
MFVRMVCRMAKYPWTSCMLFPVVQESVTAFAGPLCFVLPVPLSCDPYMASKGWGWVHR